jgi:hypothetical protein
VFLGESSQTQMLRDTLGDQSCLVAQCRASAGRHKAVSRASLISSQSAFCRRNDVPNCAAYQAADAVAERGTSTAPRRRPPRRERPRDCQAVAIVASGVDYVAFRRQSHAPNCGAWPP